jgi:hypothetical protein
MGFEIGIYIPIFQARFGGDMPSQVNWGPSEWI